MERLTKKWDLRFLKRAHDIAQWSKDPSTKCGAVFVNPDTRWEISAGYNGFPRGHDDDAGKYADRVYKLRNIVHAEINAIRNVDGICDKNLFQGSCLYVWPFLTCCDCAESVIEAGVKRVVSPVCSVEKLERWAESFRKAITMYQRAGVSVVQYDGLHEDHEGHFLHDFEMYMEHITSETVC